MRPSSWQTRLKHQDFMGRTGRQAYSHNRSRGKESGTCTSLPICSSFHHRLWNTNQCNESRTRWISNLNIIWRKWFSKTATDIDSHLVTSSTNHFTFSYVRTVSPSGGSCGTQVSSTYQTLCKRFVQKVTWQSLNLVYSYEHGWSRGGRFHQSSAFNLTTGIYDCPIL